MNSTVENHKRRQRTRVLAVKPGLEGLKRKGSGHVLIIAGGTIPEEDVPVLKEMDIETVSRPEIKTQEAADFVKVAVAHKQK